ncbi:laminin subunit alpha-1-like [Sitophilus oryzae]|uniref:Laminin subunit alpha-1-like n=1 Tax=Sitophilus oryzae TaxID=7048 RepID=A0A6J2YCZ6_SITOR|nr:laminin subunit alpha-1-like [Sitophilus oryzae]
MKDPVVQSLSLTAQPRRALTFPVLYNLADKFPLNTSQGVEQDYCGKCDCNGHSQTCNADTGECSCEHNTVGEKCERCAVGYYGNPLRGTVQDCQRCACPLEDDSNNFSPSCQLDYFNLDNEGGYVCTQCPKGYTGDHCEVCDDGYFGSPLEIGSSCKPCDCNGGPCDRKTGQCLSCKGNTEGWKCERCKQDHYGDPTIPNCKICECDPLGSISKQCHNETGQCVCREKFVGRTCDRCEVGYGNVTALCQPCACNSIGSKSGLCDIHTGICDCLPGVEGFRCDACQNLHWGFSITGCQACRCDPNGSKYSSCDPTSGNCICKTHYEGRTCDKCKDGYWKTFKKDCIKCHCNEKGSMDSVCDPENGQCKCRPGVTGQNCDKCMTSFYGTVETGCLECEPCSKPGHICGKGGKCVCPDLTSGKECDQCVTNSYGYVPQLGCKPCNCSSVGSSSLQCGQDGTCFCKPGFSGDKCDECAFGYYGYPNCRKCLCSIDGTVPEHCRDGECQCDADGNCLCKENVRSKKCNTCKEGTFGLTKDNSKGCMQCFCFHRSTHCTDTQYHWDKIRVQRSVNKREVINSDIISLPKEFTGDLTTSYGGYLSINSTGGRFTVFITGNSISLQSEINTAEIKLNERSWKITSGNISSHCQDVFTRECLLLVLQNVSSVIVQGQDMHFRIIEVLLDSAKPDNHNIRTSHTVEKCECPPEYTGLSCQDPNEGYYRHFPGPSEITATPWIDRTIGIAKPCDCSGRSNKCNPSTGHCINCTNNTTGSHCELCASGYYSRSNACLPCLCPSEFLNNANSCYPHGHGFVCNCKKGYSGSKCDVCEDEYYKDQISGRCIACNCHEYGTLFPLCDSNGKCQCKPGFQGDKCNQCSSAREYIKNGICTPCDECTQLLFHDIDQLNEDLDFAWKLFEGGLAPPWKILNDMKMRYQNLSHHFLTKQNRAKELSNKNGTLIALENKLFNMDRRVKNLDNLAEINHNEVEKYITSLQTINDDLENLKNRLESIIVSLENFDKRHLNVEKSLKKAQRILESIKKLLSVVENYEKNDNKVYRYCDEIDRKINEEYFKEPAQLPHNQLNEFVKKLNEIEQITQEINNKIDTTQIKNDNNSDRLYRLRKLIETLNSLLQNHDNNIKDIEDKLDLIEKSYQKAEDLYEQMKNLNLSDFNKLKQELEQYEEERDTLEDLLLNANKHAEEIDRTINWYKSLLNFTKEEWRTINASSAYEEIVKGIKQAKDVTNEAKDILNEALEIINPKDSDSIGTKASVAHASSDRLKQRIINLKNISNSLNSVKKKIDDFKYKLIQSGKSNNELNKILLNLEHQITRGGYVDDLNEVIKNATEISENMQLVDKDIYDLYLTSQYGIFKTYEIYKNLTSDEEANKVKEEMRKTREKLQDIYRILEDRSTDAGKEKQSPELDNIAAKIKELQNSVLYAKQMAESVDVAVSLSNCSMFYSVPHSEIFQSLAITFNCDECQLFRWNTSGDLLNLRIVKGKAVLALGNNEFIRTEQKLNNSMETTVFVSRSGQLIQIKFDNELSWRWKKIGNRFLTMDPNDVIEFGDAKTASNPSYIYKLSINDHNVGLWNLINSSNGCQGHDRVNAQDFDTAKSFYIGNGYKMLAINPAVRPDKFNLRFDFATFDEHSLIYLAQDTENPCSFISLTLDDGYLKLDIRHKNGHRVSLRTAEKYNDGSDHFVELTMILVDRKWQNYNLKTEKETETKENMLASNAVFRLKKSQHYVGGISPTLNKSCIDVSTISFVGLLSEDSQLSDESLSTGVIKKFGTGQLELEKAWFNGNGSLILNFPITSAKGDPKLNNIGFTLRPLSDTSALIDVNKVCIIALKNKLIQIDLLNEGPYEINKSLNINDYNWISITLKKDKINVLINGEEFIVPRSKTERLPEQKTVQVILGDAPGHNKFSGSIRDLLVNDEKILFSSDTVESFHNVKLGREEQLISNKIVKYKIKDLPSSTTVNIMQSTERRPPPSAYNIEPFAISLGDQAESYIQVQNNFWKRDFVLEFEFRTFEPNGMIFVSAGSTSQPHYNLLELKNGLVQFVVRGKRKTIKNWPITFVKEVNDGDWHHIKITKKNGKKLQVSLDGESKKPVRIPKTIVRNEIFFGSVPNGYIENKELKGKLRPFRGCLRNLRINNETKLNQKSGKDILSNNIRQCFPRIEEGGYFGGDAYAIYKRGFRIDKQLELNFEFRTTELNGILLTISEADDYPALYVELHDGSVIMTVNLGNGIETSVTNGLVSDLCNNMWHQVTALYSSSDLTVIVDGVIKSWVLSDAYSIVEEMVAPLYIGGLPDLSENADLIRTRQNFKGCIKNLKVQGAKTEWTDMEELHNILLNSCPVVS